MRFPDLLRLTWNNLWQNRTHSLLTGARVAIGTAALLVLLAYGSGIEQNAQREFDALKLQNTLRVTSHPIPSMTGTGGKAISVDSLRRPGRRVPLTDSLTRKIAALDGVLAAYPEMQFPAKLWSETRTLVLTAEGIPMAFQEIPTYQPRHGRFFSGPDEAAVLISPSMAERLGYQPVAGHPRPRYAPDQLLQAAYRGRPLQRRPAVAAPVRV